MMTEVAAMVEKGPIMLTEVQAELTKADTQTAT